MKKLFLTTGLCAVIHLCALSMEKEKLVVETVLHRYDVVQQYSVLKKIFKFAVFKCIAKDEPISEEEKKLQTLEAGLQTFRALSQASPLFYQFSQNLLLQKKIGDYCLGELKKQKEFLLNKLKNERSYLEDVASIRHLFNFISPAAQIALTLPNFKGIHKEIKRLIQIDALSLDPSNKEIFEKENKDKLFEWYLKRIVVEGKRDTAHYLLKNNIISINDAAQDGVTSLMSATHNGRLGLVKDLCSQGADVRARNNNKKTALDYAKSMKKSFPRNAQYASIYSFLENTTKKAKALERENREEDKKIRRLLKKKEKREKKAKKKLI